VPHPALPETEGMHGARIRRAEAGDVPMMAGRTVCLSLYQSMPKLPWPVGTSASQKSPFIAVPKPDEHLECKRIAEVTVYGIPEIRC
jgi:hypothetical protein